MAYNRAQGFIKRRKNQPQLENSKRLQKERQDNNN